MFDPPGKLTYMPYRFRKKKQKTNKKNPCQLSNSVRASTVCVLQIESEIITAKLKKLMECYSPGYPESLDTKIATDHQILRPDSPCLAHAVSHSYLCKVGVKRYQIKILQAPRW